MKCQAAAFLNCLISITSAKYAINLLLFVVVIYIVHTHTCTHNHAYNSYVKIKVNPFVLCTAIEIMCLKALTEPNQIQIKKIYNNKKRIQSQIDNVAVRPSTTIPRTQHKLRMLLRSVLRFFFCFCWVFVAVAIIFVFIVPYMKQS